MNRARAVWLCAVGIGSLIGGTASGTPTSVTIVSVPHLRASDLEDPHAPGLRALAGIAAVGWMNVRAARIRGGDDTSLAACYLTIGSGSRATARGVWRQVADGSPERLLAANASLDHAVPIGGIGDACRSAGLRIRVSGGRARAEAALLAMDRVGRVNEFIDASEAAPEAPFGVRTDLTKLDPNSRPGWLSLLTYDDLLSAEQYAPLCLPRAARQQRQRALSRLDAWIRTVVLPSARRRSDPLILIAPTSELPEAPKEALAPIAIVASDHTPGLLTSSSTRRLGLVAAVDLLPTLCAYLNSPVPNLATGRPIRHSRGDPTSWRSLHARWMRVARMQHTMGGLPTVRLVLLLVAALGLLLPRPLAGAQRLGLTAAGALIALPCAQMLLPMTQGFLARPDETWILGAAAAGAFAALSHARLRHWEIALAAALACSVIADLLLGGPAQPVSWAGYNVFDGARYYGIGNEATGAFIASMVVAGAPIVGSSGRTVRALAFLLVSVLMVHPAAGANLGGAVACAATGLAVAPRPRSRRAWHLAIASLLVVALVVGGLVLADRGPNASHLGNALASLDMVPAVAWRKMALNARLLTESAWTPALFAAAAMAFALQQRAGGWWRNTNLRAVAVAAGVLLLANDSGVPAAGEFLCVASPGLALLIRSGAQAPEPEGVHDDADG